MKRGSLLALFPAASALLALHSKSAPVPPPALTVAGFSIAVQCWSFREFTLFEAIELAAAAGIGGVEFYPGQKIGGRLGGLRFGPDLPDAGLQQLIEHLRKHQVSGVNLGVIEIPKDEASARRIFEFAAKLGLYGITTESLGALDTIEKLSREFGIRICFHNHPKPTALWDPECLWQAVEGRHENIGFCADPGHWASSGLDPVEVIRKVAPRVRSFHLKDRASITEWSHDRPFGTGVIDNIAILDEVRKHGFSGNVSIEYEHNWKTSLPEIAQCAGYLRAYAEMRG
jgi:sugar phosphate isomerase/epimerase